MAHFATGADVGRSGERAARRQESDLPESGWEARYRSRVITADLTIVSLAAVALSLGMAPRMGGAAALLALGMLTATVAGLVATRSWHTRILGQGPEEFHRVGKATFVAAVLVGAVGLAGRMTEVRVAVFAALPVAGLLLAATRYALRRVLHRARAAGTCLLPVLAAGAPATVSDLVTRTRRAPHMGWRVEAACTYDGKPLTSEGTEGDVEDVPVVGAFSSIADHVRRGGYRIVAVTGHSYWTPRRLQRLGWELEGTNAELVVAPVLMDVTGPRLHITGMFGMPLLRVSAPKFSGAQRVIKEVVDRVTATLLLAMLAPLLAGVALAIVGSDGRAPLYRQRRTGRSGRSFTMVKFRTMKPDADRQRERLLPANDGSGPLFKLRADPRVTRVGSVLRRYSLDELPQLWNVARGDMSLVGPRPPLPAETGHYGDDARRKLLVKPGMTGLWQVNGRSDLSWDESVRLDLRYVEDWSLGLDAAILWKTVRAVAQGHGAY